MDDVWSLFYTLNYWHPAGLSWLRLTQDIDRKTGSTVCSDTRLFDLDLRESRTPCFVSACVGDIARRYLSVVEFRVGVLERRL